MHVSSFRPARCRTARTAFAGLLLGAVALGVAPGTARADVPPPEVPPVVGSITPSHGPVEGGQTVTMTGEGFVDGVMVIDVDGVVVDCDVLSDTELTFVTPPHPPGSVSLAVQRVELASNAVLYYYDDGATEPAVEPPPTTATPTSEPSADVPVTTPPARDTVPGEDGSGDVPPAAPRSPAAQLPPRLASTGSPTAWTAASGLALVVLGALAVRAGRRRPAPVSR